MLIDELKQLQKDIARAKAKLYSGELSASDRNVLVREIVEKAIVVLVATEGELRKVWLKQEMAKHLN